MWCVYVFMIQKIFVDGQGNKSTFTYIPHFLSPVQCFIYQVLIYVFVNFLPVFTYNAKIIRHQKWYHKKMQYFNKNWPVYERWEAHQYPLFLYFIEKKIKARILQTTGQHVLINSCLINKYSQKNHRLYYHRDCEEVFGTCPVIASLSFGISAEVHIRNCDKSSQNMHSGLLFNLEPGSLLIMSEYSQVNFHHAITMTHDDTRYSLVFREHNNNQNSVP